LIRGLSIPDYANYVAFNSLAILSSGLVGTGINTALVRFSAEQLSRSEKKPISLYLTALSAEIAIFLFLIIGCSLFPSKIAVLVLGKESFSKVILVGLLYGMGILLLQMSRGIFQAEERFNLYISSQWIRQGLTLLLLVGLWITHNLTFENAAWVSAILSLLVGVGAFLFSSGLRKFRISAEQFNQEKGQLQQFFSVTGWLVGYFLCLTAFGQLDVITLSRVATEEQIAVYGVALRYYSIALLLLESIHAVLLPKFSQVNMQNPEAQKSFLRNWLRFSIWLIVPIAFIIVFGRDAFILLNGKNYDGSFDILIVFAFGTWLSLMFSPLTNILIGRRDFRFLFILGFLAMLSSIIGNILLVPLWKGIGAAIVVVLANNFVLQLPVIWRVRK